MKEYEIKTHLHLLLLLEKNILDRSKNICIYIQNKHGTVHTSMCVKIANREWMRNFISIRGICWNISVPFHSHHLAILCLGFIYPVRSIRVSDLGFLPLLAALLFLSPFSSPLRGIVYRVPLQILRGRLLIQSRSPPAAGTLAQVRLSCHGRCQRPSRDAGGPDGEFVCFPDPIYQACSRSLFSWVRSLFSWVPIRLWSGKGRVSGWILGGDLRFIYDLLRWILICQMSWEIGILLDNEERCHLCVFWRSLMWSAASEHRDQFSVHHVYARYDGIG